MAKQLLRCAVALGPALLLASAAQGATSGATMAVAMTVPITCTVSTAPMSFGTVDPAVSNGFVQSTIGVNCPSGVPYKVALDVGTHGNSQLRSLQNTVDPAQRITYGLYKDAALTQPWGDSDFANTALGSSVAGTGSGGNQTLTVHGVTTFIQGGVPAGTYTDTVTITVHY